jgi:hypothetical protein
MQPLEMLLESLPARVVVQKVEQHLEFNIVSFLPLQKSS